MELILGVGVPGASTLRFAFCFGAHRRPVPSKWTKPPGVSMLVCVALTLSLPIGLGFMLAAGLNPSFHAGMMEMEGTAISLALVATAILFTPRLLRPGRVRRRASVAVAA